MNIFGNTSTGFSKEKAAATKVEKQEVECTALDGVSTKANNLASKLEALFE